MQAYDQKQADTRAARRKAALESVARTGGTEAAEAKRMLASDETAKQRQENTDTSAAMPNSIAEAKGDTRAYAMADMRRQAAAESGSKPASAASRANMLKQLAKAGLAPKSAA